MGSPGIDVLIRGARVVDGTGNPWCYGDVALAGERILFQLPHAPPGRPAPRRPPCRRAQRHRPCMTRPVRVGSRQQAVGNSG